MNDFFDNLGKVAKDTAKKAMKMSGDAVEMTKASLNIKFDEAKRDNLFGEIGKAVYEMYKTNPESTSEDILDFCKCLDEVEKAINDQKSKVAGISNKKFCVNCGIKLDKSANYCYSCGAKQPEIVEEEDEECCCCCNCEEEKSDCDDSCCEDECCCEEKKDADECCDCTPQSESGEASASSDNE